MQLIKVPLLVLAGPEATEAMLRGQELTWERYGPMPLLDRQVVRVGEPWGEGVLSAIRGYAEDDIFFMTGDDFWLDRRLTVKFVQFGISLIKAGADKVTYNHTELGRWIRGGSLPPWAKDIIESVPQLPPRGIQVAVPSGWFIASLNPGLYTAEALRASVGPSWSAGECEVKGADQMREVKRFWKCFHLPFGATGTYGNDHDFCSSGMVNVRRDGKITDQGHAYAKEVGRRAGETIVLQDAEPRQ